MGAAAGERVCVRFEQLAADINQHHPDDPPLEVQVEIEPPRAGEESGEAPVA